MSDENHISRRASLRGIATAGALIGGTGLGVSTVSAGDKRVDGVKSVDFENCHSMTVHFEDGYAKSKHKKRGFVKRLRIRTFNAKRGRVENVQQTITKDDLRSGGRRGKTDGAYSWTFHVFQFYDHTIDAGDKILSVHVDGKTLENPNDCAAKVPDGYDKKGRLDATEIDLVPVCRDPTWETARFRVENRNKKPVTVGYDVAMSDQEGEVFVEPKSTTYIDVDSRNGKARVAISVNGQRVDRVNNHKTPECVPWSKFSVAAECVDPCDERARFRVMNNTRDSRTLVYRVAETGKTGTVTIESDGATEYGELSVKAPDGKATVSLYYEGRLIDKDGSDPHELCEPETVVDSDAIDLVPLCYEKASKRKGWDNAHGKFRIDNHSKTPVAVEWDVYDDDQSGVHCVPKRDSVEFWVDLGEDWMDEPTNVRLYYDGEQIEVHNANTEKRCGHRGKK